MDIPGIPGNPRVLKNISWDFCIRGLDKLSVLPALLGDAYGGSEGRTDFLAATATPPLCRGHLVPAERGVHPGGHGRERLRVGRAHNDRTHGAREGILLGPGNRLVLHLPGALMSLPVPAIHGAPVRREICVFTGGCAKLARDREPGEPQTHHQRVFEGAVLVLHATPHHDFCGMGSEGRE